MAYVIPIWFNNKEYEKIEKFCKKYHYDKRSTLIKSVVFAFIDKYEKGVIDERSSTD